MPKNPHAQALGTLGGKARARSTTPEQRKAWASLGGYPKGRPRKPVEKLTQEV